MTIASRLKLVQDLMRDEAFRGQVYDDATGQPILPGSHVQGHPTVGYGRALDVNPLSQGEAAILLERSTGVVEAECLRLVPNFELLCEVRQRVLVEMAYQLG